MHSNLLGRVLADHERIGHVFSNLIVNAIRHTPRDGSITVSATLADSVRFAVADSGRGIPQQYRERIFEKFFRVPDSEPKGTGLGLYIAREIVRGHGGDIGVESRAGKGKRLLVYIARCNKYRLERSPAMTLPQSRILVADDERNVRKNLAMVLEAADYWVDEAKDGDEALALCKNNHPDIAFVDLHMPKLAGLEVLGHIRAAQSQDSGGDYYRLWFGGQRRASHETRRGGIFGKTLRPQSDRALSRGNSFSPATRIRHVIRRSHALGGTRARTKSQYRGTRLPQSGDVASARSAGALLLAGFSGENEGDERRAVQYYYMAITADHSYEAATAALKRLGKLH